MRFAAVTIMLTASALGAGCASTDAELRRELSKERNEALTPVSRADIGAQPAGSPQRAVLLLWRAIQFRDAKSVVPVLEPRPGPRLLSPVEEFVVGGGAVIAQSMTPRILESAGNSARASVVVELVRTESTTDEPSTRTTRPLKLSLVRVGSDWKLRWRAALRQLIAAAT